MALRAIARNHHTTGDTMPTPTTTGEDVPTTTPTTTGEDVPTTTPTTPTTAHAITTGETVAAAIAARRARRADTASEMAAADAIARMSARMGEDVIGASVIASLARARDAGADAMTTGELVTAAWSNARRTRGHAAMSAAADADRVNTYTGRMVTTCTTCHGRGDECESCRGTGRESWAMRAARVAAQHVHVANVDCRRVMTEDERAAIASADATFANVTRRPWAMRDADAILTFERPACTTSTTVAAWAMPALDGHHVPMRNTCRYCAVIAAIAADGPTTKPDHDPATCAVTACRKCAGIRARRNVTDAPANALTRAPRKGSVERRRAARADRAPREKTGRGVIATKRGKSYGDRVELLRESDTAKLLDRVAHTNAGMATHFESAEPTTWVTDDAITAAMFATLPSVGQRGYRVAWAEWAADHAARTGQRVNVAAWRASVTARIGAWAIAANYFPTDDTGHVTAAAITRMARAANVSTGELAAAMADHADGPDHDAAHAARMAHRADMRTELATRPAAMAHADAMARDRAAHAARMADRAAADALRAEYADAIASARATFRDQSARIAARGIRGTV